MTPGPLEAAEPNGSPEEGTGPTLERIEADVEQIAQDVPVELRRLVELLRRQSFTGPLPPPEILEGYKASYPQAPEIIFGELVKQGEHRRGLEQTAIRRQEVRADRGQIFALVIVLAVLGVALFAIREGQGWVAVALFGSALVGVVALFIFGTRRTLADLAEKKRALEALTGEEGDDKP